MIYFAIALKEEVGELGFEKFLGEDYKIIYTGVGKVNAALHLQEAVLESRPSLVVNIGTAGTPKHRIGDVLICNEFFDGDLVEIESAVKHLKFGLPARYEAVFKPSRSVTTQDTFSCYSRPITTDASDMESFALARVCERYGLPFVAIKIVTDIIGQTSISKWEEQLPEARIKAQAVLNGINEEF